MNELGNATEIVRLAFMVAAGLYVGVAVRVLLHYFRNAPTTSLRRYHVIGVSVGTTLLVAGLTGLVVDLNGREEPLVWYGAPVGLAGVVCVTTALAILSREQRRHDRRRGQPGENLGRRVVDRDPPAPTR